MGRKRIYTAGSKVRVTAQHEAALTRRREEAGGTWADAVRYSLDLLCQEQQQADDLQDHLATLGVTGPSEATPEERRAAIVAISAMQLPGEMLSLSDKLRLIQDQEILRASGQGKAALEPEDIS